MSDTAGVCGIKIECEDIPNSVGECTIKQESVIVPDNAGVCAIKPEYVIVRPNNSEVSEGKRKLDDNDDIETNDKKVKSGKEQWKSKNKQRGQNKARPRTFHDDKHSKPCPTIINIKSEEEKLECTFKNCLYIHTALEYIKSKPEDLGETCHVFNIRGWCPRGIACRYASKHITDEGFNLKDDEKFKLWKDDTKNTLQVSVQTLLHKKKYDLSLAERLVKAIEPRHRNQDQNSNKDQTSETKKNSGCITDEDLIKLLPKEKKTIDWKNKLYLSPLTTVGNLPFRRICKVYGADITCGEMALCEQLLKGFKQEWALVKRHESEDIFGAQICGNNPFIITKVAQLLQENTELDFIDLNMGCPIDLIYTNGGGSGMMHRLNNLETTVRSCSKLLSIPFTVKMRTGVKESKKLAHTIVPKILECGASLITLHGRSKEGRYTKSADWEYIETCAKLAAPCPLIGNGDILSYEDFLLRKEIAPSTVGVMIGRGALIKPWIFTEIKEQRQWDISSKERFEILRQYTNYGLEHWGSDTQGVENTRRFLLEWLSFLYRYVPVGLLEKPPQKINERPPAYIGRDDLETLMASGNCADWIKISEMLLGPIPLGFHFIPKHKSNSYQGVQG